MKIVLMVDDGQGQGNSSLESLMECLQGVDVQALEAKVQETAFDPMWIFFVIQLFMWFRQLQNPNAPPIPMPPMPPMPMEATSTNAA